MPQPKDKDWLNGYKKKHLYICYPHETHLKTRDSYRLKVKGCRKIFHTNGDKKNNNRSSNSHISKIDFKIKDVKNDKEIHFIMIK